MKLTTVTVRGQDFDVHVNDAGEFFAEVDGERYEAKTLDELRSKIARATLRQKKLSITFVQWEPAEKLRAGSKPGKLRHGVCTGRHASNKNYFVKWDGVQKSEQVRYWEFRAAVDPAVALEYTALCQATDEATRAQLDFEHQHKVDIETLVEKAYEAAEKEGAA